MRIYKKRSNKKIIVSVVTVTIILLVSIASAFFFKAGPFTPHSNNSTKTQSSSDDEKEAGNNTKQRSADQTKDEEAGIGSDPSPAPRPIDGSEKKSAGMEITATNQNESVLQVRTLIQTITNSGSCIISMKNAQGMTYSATAEVQASSSTTTCKGFDIPLNQLTSGVWTITIDFNGDKIIASTSKQVTIQ